MENFGITPFLCQCQLEKSHNTLLSYIRFQTVEVFQSDINARFSVWVGQKIRPLIQKKDFQLYHSKYCEHRSINSPSGTNYEVGEVPKDCHTCDLKVESSSPGPCTYVVFLGKTLNSHSASLQPGV